MGRGLYYHLTSNPSSAISKRFTAGGQNEPSMGEKMNRFLKIFLLSMSIILLIVGCTKQEEEPAIIVDSAISADGNAIHYQVQGQGKPALIFIHGWCCDRSYWDAQLPYFAKKYKVVAIDLAGHAQLAAEFCL